MDYSDLIHTISLGVFSYKKCPTIKWKLWSLCNVICITSVLIPNTLYLLAENSTLRDWVFASISVFLFIMILTTQKLFHNFCENWNRLNKILDKDFIGSLDVSGDLRHNERVTNQKTRYKRKLNRIIISYVNFNLILLLGSFLGLCFGQDVDFGDNFNYWYPFYGIHEVKTRATFLLVYTLQSICFTLPVLTLFPEWLLILILAEEISIRTTALEERMKSISEDVHRDVAVIREYEMKTDTKSPMLENLVQRKSQNDRKICFQKFEENLKTCIRHHQIIQRAVKLLRPFLNDYFTINLTFVVLNMVALGFTIISERNWKLDMYVMKQLVTFTFLMIHIGLECQVAQRFQNMNDRIAEQVYSLPWYELSPKQRKNVYIFLCQAQAPVNFYAFKTFRFSTFFFPTIVNFVYTYTVNLLTVQNRYHSN